MTDSRPVNSHIRSASQHCMFAQRPIGAHCPNPGYSLALFSPNTSMATPLHPDHSFFPAPPRSLSSSQVGRLLIRSIADETPESPTGESVGGASFCGGAL